MRKITLITVLIFGIISFSRAAGCRIDFYIKGYEQKQLLFGYEYGTRQIITDTLKFDEKAHAYYQSKKRLTGGIYLLIFQNKKYLEFLINDEQYFSLLSDTANILENLNIEGSEETELFCNYQKMATKFNLEKSDTLNKIKSNIALKDFREKVKTNHPQSFLASYFKMMEDPTLPEKTSGGKMSKSDFLEKYEFTKVHYLDNIDFNDPRLLRTSLIAEKLEHYFNRLLPQNSDSLIKAINSLVEKTKKNQESYSFVLSFLLSDFKSAKTPEIEKVFVYIADNYFLNGKATWADKRFLTLLEKRVSSMRASVMGNIAPDLKMVTIEGKEINLSSLKSKYVVLYFWSPDCNICQVETPKLFDLYKDMRSNDVQVFAVYVHADKEIWKNYVKENKIDWINVYDPLLKSNFEELYNVHSTPQTFLLDSNRKIIGKNLSIEQLKKLLKNASN